MDAPGGDQIGLEPDSVETDAVIERGSDPGPAGRRGVDRDQPLGDRDCRFLAQDAVAQLALPVRIAIGIELFHDEEAGVSILGHEARDRARPDRLRLGEPLPFGVVALYRRFPNLRHLELRQGALQAIFSRADLDTTSKTVVRREQAYAPKHGIQQSVFMENGGTSL